MELHTKNLTLKTVEDSDLGEVARMWEPEKGLLTAEEAQKAIDYMRNNHRKNKPGSIYHLCFAVFEKGGGSIIGWCGLDGKTAGKLHIFYMIDPAYRNRGFATQCAAELLSYAFDTAKVSYVNGGCAQDNIASYKVMTKIGMKQDGFEENGDPLFFVSREQYHDA
jgi:RimJ/RimL family protein N-acetyltransferase